MSGYAALAPWFGAKRTLAETIIEEIGPHRVYWEPFCGSMAVLMSKPTCKMETVNDLHADLVNLALVVRDGVQGPRLYRSLRRTLFAEAIFREAHAVISTPWKPGPAPDLERADERLSTLYPGWRQRTIEVSKSLVNQGKRDQSGATSALEVLLVNDTVAAKVAKPVVDMGRGRQPSFAFGD